jgi:triacylglycerol lipase
MPNKRTIREVLPEVTWDKIAPPYLDYPYFQGIETYPFRPLADEFDLINAWWLIEASTLAYAGEDFAREKFHHAGFPEIAFFHGHSTQCYVANNDDFLILVFRGTEIRRRKDRFSFSNILADLETDADIALVESGQGGKVHRGFKRALGEVWEKQGLRDYLKSKENPRRTVWFTGHSLGAALATLAAQRYGKVRGLYTYGSPRVGDRGFKDGFPIKTYRFVNNNDIVTRVPLPQLYHHVGDLKHIDRRGFIHQGSDKKMHVIQMEISSFLNYLQGMTASLDALIPGALVDHVPILYATHIWNNLP